MSVDVMLRDLQIDRERYVGLFVGSSCSLWRLSPFYLWRKCCYVDKKGELGEERRHAASLL